MMETKGRLRRPFSMPKSDVLSMYGEEKETPLPDRVNGKRRKRAGTSGWLNGRLQASFG